ncbi:hypothetical protein [Sphingobium scionense]|uniref:hypothetical protein n=1 Tax=Sphingobium scionense TaxID=1404341 RepID=UPI001CB6D6E0|nr:hypothetical protein [Sphingobium scionense]
MGKGIRRASVENLLIRYARIRELLEEFQSQAIAAIVRRATSLSNLIRSNASDTILHWEEGDAERAG